jgi:hypothetical protein
VSVLRSQFRDRVNTEENYPRDNSNWPRKHYRDVLFNCLKPKRLDLRCLSQQNGIRGAQKYAIIASFISD